MFNSDLIILKIENCHFFENLRWHPWICMSTQARQLFAPGKTTWIKSIQSGFTYPGGANAKRCFSKGIDIWIFLPKFKSVGRFLFRIPQIESFPSENPIFEFHCWFWIESCIFEEKMRHWKEKTPPIPVSAPFLVLLQWEKYFLKFFWYFLPIFWKNETLFTKTDDIELIFKEFPFELFQFRNFSVFPWAWSWPILT